MRLLKAGDRVVAGGDLHGGTYRLFAEIFGRFGMEFGFVDVQAPETAGRMPAPTTTRRFESRVRAAVPN